MSFNVDWFEIVRHYLVSEGNAELDALFAEVGYSIYEETLPHGYDGGKAIVLSATPDSGAILNGTSAGVGEVEMVSNCYAAQTEDRAGAKALDAVLESALDSVRFNKSEVGSIMLAVVRGFSGTFVEPSETRRAFSRRLWRVNVSAVTTGV